LNLFLINIQKATPDICKYACKPIENNLFLFDRPAICTVNVVCVNIGPTIQPIISAFSTAIVQTWTPQAVQAAPVDSVIAKKRSAMNPMNASPAPRPLAFRRPAIKHL